MPMEMPIHPPERELPRLTLRQEELPEVKTWKVNDKKYLIIKVEMIGQRNTKSVGAEDSSDKGKMEGEFQMLSVKPLKDKNVNVKTLERSDWEAKVAGALGGGQRE